VEQTVGLAVGRADDFDLARVDRLAQFAERVGSFRREPLVADAVEVDVAFRAGRRDQTEHVARRARQRAVAHNHCMSTQCM